MVHRWFQCIHLICVVLVLARGPDAAGQPLAPEEKESPQSKHVSIIPAVKVKPTAWATPKEGARLSTTHVLRNKIETSPVIVLTELLRQEQSVVRVVYQSADVGQTALSIRGFGDNAAANSLILVDGFPLTNPSLLAPNINAIALADIEQIDIQQGSAGTLWGDQAVGGVVNIITKRPKKYVAHLDASGGSYQKKFVGALIGDRFYGRYALQGYAFAYETNNYRHHQQQHGAAWATQGSATYGRGSLSAGLQAYDDTRHLPGGLTEAQYAHTPQQATNFVSFVHFRGQMLQVAHLHELNDKWTWEARGSYHLVRGDGIVYQHFDRRDILGRISPRLVGSVYGGSKLVLGYDGQMGRYGFDSPRIYAKATAQQHGLFAQATVPVSQWSFTLGGRSTWQYNDFVSTGRRPSTPLERASVAEVGARYRFQDQMSFFVRRDGNFSFPKGNEETSLSLDVDHLHVQTGASYEAGAEWHVPRHYGQVMLFYMPIKNEIAYDPTQSPIQPFGAFKNYPGTVRQGFALTDDYRLNAAISLNGQLNYVRARFSRGQFAGNDVPAVPAWTANFALDHRFAAHWGAHYTALYTGSRYASEDVMNVGKKLPAYWIGNLALRYFVRPVTVSAEVLNVFNQRFPLYVLYDSSRNQMTYYPGAGRNFLLSLKANFG